MRCWTLSLNIQAAVRPVKAKKLRGETRCEEFDGWCQLSVDAVSFLETSRPSSDWCEADAGEKERKRVKVEKGWREIERWWVGERDNGQEMKREAGRDRFGARSGR